MKVIGKVALVTVLLVTSCEINDGPNGPTLVGGAALTGEVTHIRNDIAVDGGITLDILVSGGGVDRLIFPGLFRGAAAIEEVLQLYDVVSRVEVGDVVRAEGRRRDVGLTIEKLWILRSRS